jgi:hypothetical protein
MGFHIVHLSCDLLSKTQFTKNFGVTHGLSQCASVMRPPNQNPIH